MIYINLVFSKGLAYDGGNPEKGDLSVRKEQNHACTRQYIYPEKPDCDDDIVVFHSGFSSTMANYSHGKDTRDYYLIHWVTRGRGTYQTETAKYSLREGDGFLILPGQTIRSHGGQRGALGSLLGRFFRAESRGDSEGSRSG